MTAKLLKEMNMLKASITGIHALTDTPTHTNRHTYAHMRVCRHTSDTDAPQQRHRQT